MPALPKNLSPKVTVILLLYLLASGAALTLLLSAQLGQLARDQEAALGRALATQLAESLKQPLIDSNPISMQVILDNLLGDTETVVRATLYSAANQILAQSQRSAATGTVLSAYTSAVSVENTLLGQVRVELDHSAFMHSYRLPAWSALGVWLAASVLFALWLRRTASTYSHRIETLNEQLKAGGEGGSLSELATLEHALAPFHKEPEHAGAEAVEFSMLAIDIPNLPKWRAQFSAETFTDMMEKVDHLIDSHLQLFGGKRLQSRNHAIVLIFENSETDSAIQWVIHCANALLKLGAKLAHNENLPLELRLAAACRKPAFRGSPWCEELERQDCVERLVEILPLAGPWELVIDRTELSYQELDGCKLEEFGSAAAWQFLGYDETRQGVFDQQVAFLDANLA